ncbi:hypothetical protein [Sphingobacterium tabacisoli]|uniref:Yip1 domain-containing protein n=1 Tax=Sphingobacterium tabacisoli TaxID=2044855 RepID=A0ABW5KWU9_9SPHI|nr:hypothetical protein [Sphingobacterium tabacisoli]
MLKNSWNPFIHNSELKLLVIGLVGFVFAALLSSYNDVMLLGALKIVNTKPMLWYVSLCNLGITLLANILVLYLFAILRFAKTRFIDVVNSVLIAHLAMYLLLLITVIPFVSDFLKSMEFLVLDHIDNPTGISVDKIGLMLVFAFFSLACLIGFFSLLLKGMKIAMNSKVGGDTIAIVLLTLVLNTVLQFINIYL